MRLSRQDGQSTSGNCRQEETTKRPYPRRRRSLSPRRTSRARGYPRARSALPRRRRPQAAQPRRGRHRRPEGACLPRFQGSYSSHACETCNAEPVGAFRPTPADNNGRKRACCRWPRVLERRRLPEVAASLTPRKTTVRIAIGHRRSTDGEDGRDPRKQTRCRGPQRGAQRHAPSRAHSVATSRRHASATSRSSEGRDASAGHSF